MTGSILLLSVPRDKRVLVIAIGAVGILTGMSIMAHSHNQWVSVGAAVIQSTCISLSMGLSSVMVQEWVPDRLRGRVMSLYMLMFMGIMPFSSLMITSIVDRVGMRQELQAAAVIYFIFAMVAIRQLHATHDPHAEQG
jgi:MFS family permease